MFGWISGAFDTVVNWVVDTAGEEVGAVAGSAINGAASGALAGAFMAAINGDDVLDGALRGAAYGGAVGTAGSILGQLSGIDQFSAKNQLNSMGGKNASNDRHSLTDNGKMPETDSGIGSDTTFSNNSQPSNPSPGPAPSQNNTPTPGGNNLSNKDNSNILGNAALGLMQGAGEYLSSKENAESDRELAEWKEQQYYERIDNNQPANVLAAQTAKIDVENWWNKHLQKSSGGLLGSATATGAKA